MSAEMYNGLWGSTFFLGGFRPRVWRDWGFGKEMEFLSKFWEIAAVA